MGVLELGVEGWEVAAIEEELLVFGTRVLDGLEEFDDGLEIWREIFNGLERRNR